MAQRLAVLLDAGVAPTSAWGFLAEASADAADGGGHDSATARRHEDSGVAVRVATDVDGLGIAAAIDRASDALSVAEARAWRGLAAAWHVASTAGAPLAPTLREYAASLRSLADADRDIEVALAAPRATARVVLVLPLLGVLFGSLMGFGSVEVLLGTPLGWGCLSVGVGLMLGSAAWSRRLIASARPDDPAPGLDCDLLAIALSGGSSLERAQAAADEAIERFALRVVDRSRSSTAVRLSSRAGAPVTELLRAEAEEARRDARADAQRAAAALSVRLMLPLGVCVLPAFLVLGVLPLVAAVLSTVVGGVG